jgi:hypothetical protein
MLTVPSSFLPSVTEQSLHELLRAVTPSRSAAEVRKNKTFQLIFLEI